MAFNVDMSPLERSSMNIGSALVDVGRSINQGVQQSQQQQQQGDIEAFMRQAMDGDPVALKELMVKSPQAAQQVAQYIQSQQAGQQAEQDRFQGEIAQNTASFVEQIHLAPQEQQEAMFNAAIDDPRYDIDEEDRPYFMNKNARKALVAQVKGKDYAENFFGGINAQKPTANIKDFDHYRNLKSKDPEAAEQFALLSGIAKKENITVKPTTAMQNFDKWQAMPEGESKNAFAKVIGITPKDTVKSARAKIERVEAKKQEIENANLMKEKVNDFLANSDFIGSVTGATSRLPAVFEGSVDAEAAFDSLKDSLTMENLDKMSGVLTDKDIQLLANAASALRYGMSEGQLKVEMNKILKAMDRTINKALEGIPSESVTTTSSVIDNENVNEVQLSESAKKYLGG